MLDEGVHDQSSILEEADWMIYHADPGCSNNYELIGRNYNSISTLTADPYKHSYVNQKKVNSVLLSFEKRKRMRSLSNTARKIEQIVDILSISRPSFIEKDIKKNLEE